MCGLLCDRDFALVDDCGFRGGNREAGREETLYELGCGAVYLVVLWAMTALFFGGRYQGVGVTAIVIFGGAILTVLLPGKLEMKAKSHRSKKRRR